MKHQSRYAPERPRTPGDKDHRAIKTTVLTEAFTELAPRYESVVDRELNRFWGWSYIGFIDRLIESAPISNGDRILDIATGTAVIPRRLAVACEKAQKECHLIGLDITPAMLKRAKAKLTTDLEHRFHGFGEGNANIELICGDAMKMPFEQASFNVVLCGLATHHMNVPRLLSEIKRILKSGGQLALADAGGSRLWDLRIIRVIISIVAFIYFLMTENRTRAWAEASAVSNIRKPEDWYAILSELGFIDITITRLPTSNFWAPAPLLIKAITS